MKPTFKLDTVAFHKMLQDMQRMLPAVAFSDIVDFEVGRILEATIRGTKTATRASIRKTFDKSSMEDNTIPSHRPNGFYRLPNGKVRVRGQRIKSDDWQAYKAAIPGRMQEQISRAGIARQGWTHIAGTLGIQVNSPAANRAKLARVNGKVIKHKSTGRRMNQGQQDYAVAIDYRIPYGRYIGAEGALQRAINGRVNYFQNNINHGVFRNAQSVAKRYPGLIVQ